MSNFWPNFSYNVSVWVQKWWKNMPTYHTVSLSHIHSGYTSSEQPVQAPISSVHCCLATPKRPWMRMQRSSFAHTSAIRAYCQLYYCALYTCDHRKSHVSSKRINNNNNNSAYCMIHFLTSNIYVAFWAARMHSIFFESPEWGTIGIFLKKNMAVL